MKYSFATARKIDKFIRNNLWAKTKDIAKHFNMKDYEITQILLKYNNKSYTEIRKEEFKKIAKNKSVKELMKIFKISKDTVIRWRKELNCQREFINIELKDLRKLLKEFNYNAMNISIYLDIPYNTVLRNIHNNKKIYEEYRMNNKISKKKNVGSKEYLKEVEDFVNKKLPTLNEKLLFSKYLANKYNKNYKWVLTYINKKLRSIYGVSRANKNNIT